MKESRPRACTLLEKGCIRYGVVGWRQIPLNSQTVLIRAVAIGQDWSHFAAPLETHVCSAHRAQSLLCTEKKKEKTGKSSWQKGSIRCQVCCAACSQHSTEVVPCYNTKKSLHINRRSSNL
eukprot:1155816-Pelagomonas_calceolata.AAC.2